MSSHLAIRLDHGTTISREPDVARRVAQILTRPALAVLARVSARERDRWSKHAPATAETIEQYLTNEANDSVALDNGRDGELTASAEIESGPHLNVKAPPAVRFIAYLVLPYEAARLEEVLTAAFDLATTMRATAGFVAVEPTYGLAHRVAIGQSIPKDRVGLSAQRIAERRVRDFKSEQLDSLLAGLEWGTFVGAGARKKLDLAELRRSGVFNRIVEVNPEIAFLQLTASPEDDLAVDAEDRFTRARSLLSSVLLDTSDLPGLPDPSV
jgi:hypothetical protein